MLTALNSRQVRAGQWRRGGLMVRLVSESSASPGSMPDRAHCVVFSDKIKYSGSSSLHLDV